jgi:hypothetical protein
MTLRRKNSASNSKAFVVLPCPMSHMSAYHHVKLSEHHESYHFHSPCAIDVECAVNESLVFGQETCSSLAGDCLTKMVSECDTRPPSLHDARKGARPGPTWCKPHMSERDSIPAKDTVSIRVLLRCFLRRYDAQKIQHRNSSTSNKFWIFAVHRSPGCSTVPWREQAAKVVIYTAAHLDH